MTHDAREISAESGAPIELYTISVGAETYRWTSAQDTISYQGNDYDPVAVVRDAYSQGPDDRDNTLSLTVPATNAFVQPYRVMPPTDKPTIIVTRLHRGETLGVVAWKGRIQTVTFSAQNTKAIIQCLPDVGASSRPVPRHTYAGLCAAVLFGTECGVTEASFMYTGNVSVVSANGKTLTVDGLNTAKGAGWAAAGHVTFGGEKRMIIAQSGDDLTLNAPFATSPIGTNVDVSAGCDHTPTTCAVKFSNLARIRGFAWVPQTDPFAAGLDGIV